MEMILINPAFHRKTKVEKQKKNSRTDEIWH